MKLKVKLLMSCDTQSGVSKATGREWKSKEVIFENEEDGSTFAVKTLNEKHIELLERAIEGDTFCAEFKFFSRAKDYRRADGTMGVFRSTEISLMGLELVEEAGF